MFVMSNNPANRQREAPTLAAADELLERHLADRLKTADANDLAYAVDASHDYDPAPGLERIAAPLLAINFADDLINPPELGILEREIARVPHGRAVVVPAGPLSVGHGTHSVAATWKDELVRFLAELPATP
jgi:homoserine O-acetyltransferase